VTRPLLSGSTAVLGILLLTGCRGVDKGALTGRASDQWTRSYPLAAGGEFQIVGGNGTVDIRGGDAATVEVAAERVAIAATESSAREIVPRIRIREDVTPDKVVLQSVGLEGLVIGVDVVINYHVTVPRRARVRVRVANGAVAIADLDGSVVLTAANGAVTATNLQGGIDARSVNGRLTIDLAALGENPVDLRTVNGALSLTVPSDGGATLTVTTVSGKVTVENLTTEPIGDQTKRRQRLRLNQGGTPIEINTVNGEVHVSARP
jgi:hypothetical protein